MSEMSIILVTEALFGLADELGVITEEDFSAVTSHGFSPEEQKLQISEMIRRDRNHPGIICFNIADEPGMNGNRMFAAGEDSTRIIIRFRHALILLLHILYMGVATFIL